MAQKYEKSPRQRTEWFGSKVEFDLNTNTADEGKATGSILLAHPARISLSAGTVNNMAFPAGIVRGETCSIARLTGFLSIYDVDRRQQNISYEMAAGLIRQEVEDDAIADPTSIGSVVAAPDPLDELRASWLWHRQIVWNPQSAGANYTVASWDTEMDTTNSRIFESNEVMQFAVQVRTRVNSGSAVAIPLRCTLLWRALMRLD